MQSATRISVVIPAYNAEAFLRRCLESLAQGNAGSLETIVVDDGSTDSTKRIAYEFGARVVPTGGRKGPAFARNLGARNAAGEILFFLDSDVCLHVDSLERVSAHFSADPVLTALMGSYDDSPDSKDFLSAYRNLMHRYVHQSGKRQACTFWSGCGAIRRDVFLEMGGFDESYGRPAIEDIELGYRLATAGHRVILEHGLEVKHLKKWTFLNLLKTDIMDRGIPWTELILRDRRMPNDLNLQMSHRVSVALAFLLFGVSTLGAIYYGGFFLVPLMGLLFFLLGCYWVEAAVKPETTGAKLTVCLVVGIYSLLAYMHHMLAIIPPVLLGAVLLFLRQRFSYATKKRRRVSGIAYAAYLLVSIAFLLTYLPTRPLVLIFYGILLAVVIVNNHFYRFLGTRMGWLTALTAIPFQILFYFYNGISFLAGLTFHLQRTFGSKRPRVAENPAKGGPL